MLLPYSLFCLPELYQQLSAVSTATPSRIQSALREAERATGRIESLNASHKKVKRDVQSHLNQVSDAIQNAVWCNLKPVLTK